MSRPTAAVTNRYINKAYDRLNIIIPKGQKEKVEAYAQANGESVNGLVNRLLREAMNVQPEEWKAVEREAE